MPASTSDRYRTLRDRDPEKLDELIVTTYGHDAVEVDRRQIKKGLWGKEWEVTIQLPESVAPPAVTVTEESDPEPVALAALPSGPPEEPADADDAARGAATAAENDGTMSAPELADGEAEDERDTAGEAGGDTTGMAADAAGTPPELYYDAERRIIVKGEATLEAVKAPAYDNDTEDTADLDAARSASEQLLADAHEQAREIIAAAQGERAVLLDDAAREAAELLAAVRDQAGNAEAHLTIRQAQITAAALVTGAQEQAAGIHAQAADIISDARDQADAIHAGAREQGDALLAAASAQADSILADAQTISDSARMLSQILQAAADGAAADIERARQELLDRARVDAVEARLRLATVPGADEMSA